MHKYYALCSLLRQITWYTINNLSRRTILIDKALRNNERNSFYLTTKPNSLIKSYKYLHIGIGYLLVLTILNISKLIQLNNCFQWSIMLQCLLNGIYTIIVGIKYILPSLETFMLNKTLFQIHFH